MKNLKLFTWYPSMVHIMSNGMVQYTFNFHKYYKSFILFLKNIMFLSTHALYIRFNKYTPISHFIKLNEIYIFIISWLGYMQKYCEKLSKV
jgi:hypothetical protein